MPGRRAGQQSAQCFRSEAWTLQTLDPGLSPASAAELRQFSWCAPRSGESSGSGHSSCSWSFCAPGRAAGTSGDTHGAEGRGDAVHRAGRNSRGDALSGILPADRSSSGKREGTSRRAVSLIRSAADRIKRGLVCSGKLPRASSHHDDSAGEDEVPPVLPPPLLGQHGRCSSWGSTDFLKAMPWRRSAPASSEFASRLRSRRRGHGNDSGNVSDSRRGEQRRPCARGSLTILPSLDLERRNSVSLSAADVPSPVMTFVERNCSVPASPLPLAPGQLPLQLRSIGVNDSTAPRRRRKPQTAELPSLVSSLFAVGGSGQDADSAGTRCITEYAAPLRRSCSAPPPVAPAAGDVPSPSKISSCITPTSNIGPLPSVPWLVSAEDCPTLAAEASADVASCKKLQEAQRLLAMMLAPDSKGGGSSVEQVHDAGARSKRRRASAPPLTVGRPGIPSHNECGREADSAPQSPRRARCSSFIDKSCTSSPRTVPSLRPLNGSIPWFPSEVPCHEDYPIRA